MSDSKRGSPISQAEKLTTPRSSKPKPAQVRAARVRTADYAARNGLTAGELAELLEALDIGPEVKG